MKKFTRWPKFTARTLNYPEIPVHQILRSSAAKWPFHVCMIFEGLEITYGEFLTVCERFAGALAGMGVRKGDRVAIHLPNCPQFAISYFGTLMNGAVFTPCSPLMVARELEHQLNDAGAETLITLDLLYPLVKEVVPRTRVKRVFVASFAEVCPPLLAGVRPPRAKEEFPGAFRFSEALNSSAAPAPNVQIDPRRDLAHLAYTGGTTGISKGVMLTHFNVASSVFQGAHWWAGGDVVLKDGLLEVAREPGDGEGEHVIAFGQGRTLVVAPWFHAMGIRSFLVFPVYMGTTLVVFPRFEAGQFLQAIEKYEINVIGGAPQLFIPLVNHPDFKKYNLSSIRAVGSGAAPLPVAVLEEMHKSMPGVITEGYGLTEVTCASHVNPPVRGGIKAGSVGLPIADTECRIVDAETGTKEVPQGEIGEVCLRGPQVMQGYWNRPDETRHVVRDGWLYTGDIGREDEDGYLYIVDRKKDMLLYKGYNVYPRELEEVMARHPAVQQCAVVGRPDREAGEIPVAFVVLKDGEKISGDELLEYCAKNVSPYKRIRQIVFKAQLPVSGPGKILKTELRKELLA